MANIDKSYIQTLNELKSKIKTAQIKAALSVNAEMIYLYWEIGNTILQKQQQEGWGANIINRLSGDLQKSFPDMKGFSPRNLGYMKKFAETYPDSIILQEVLAKITWYRNITLLDKIKSDNERLWYANKIIENGWSRNVLVHQIEGSLYNRQALAQKTNNFDLTLPKPQSDLARELLKDPYKFDFLSVSDEAYEREIEKELVKHITHFLLELGKGFAFVGQQYHLEVSGQDYYIDLLFYHTKLKCYVVIELKAGAFKPEYAGKLNFYLSAVDDLVKDENDNPSIGIILCKSKDKLTAEYSLRNLISPISVNEYKLVESIPNELKLTLPTIEEIERELDGIEDK